jgi:signal transduction histidine kinase
LHADERKLKQILFNLLSNAVKYTREGGTITIDAGLGSEEVELRVKDSGIGIAPADLDRVFGEFEQVETTYGRTQQGTGLGLALAKRLIEMHGGCICAQSDGEGRGSTFAFTLPVKGQEAEEREE